jgi:hypothetical protein
MQVMSARTRGHAVEIGGGLVYDQLMTAPRFLGDDDLARIIRHAALVLEAAAPQPVLDLMIPGRVILSSEIS